MKIGRHPAQLSFLLSAIALLLIPLTSGDASAEPDPDEDLTALIAAAGNAEDHPDATAVIVLDRTETEVEESGLSHVVQHRVIKILTEAGGRDQGHQRFDYDPATQDLEIRRVVIHRVGGTIEPVDPGAAADVIAPARSIYWGVRMRLLALPRLRIGDAVEIETYRKGFQIAYLGAEQAPAAGRTTTGDQADDDRYIPPMRGHFYDVVLFQGPLPIVEQTYTVRTPRDKPLQFAVYNGEVFSSVTFDATHFTYRFWRGDLPPAPREWRSPRTSDYVPKVVMATVQDWGEKSRWFYQANAQQFATTPEITAQVHELTRGADSVDEKIAAINHWVAQEIRYCGLNMGAGEGYTLHPGEMIYTERSGVCKDIAGMSITMLRAAGLEVYPAMTMAGARVEAIPADQFNHCVGAVRLADGSFRMIDPTWIPFSRYDWSLAEGEQHYVIGTPEGEDLEITVAFSPEENRVSLKVSGTIADDGALDGHLELAAYGYPETRLRRNLGNVPRPEAHRRLAHWLAALSPGAELLDAQYDDPADFSRPLRLRLDFRLPGYGSVGETTVTWAPITPQLIMANYSGLFRFAARDLPEERSTPALIWFPQQVKIDEEIRVAKGYRAQVGTGVWAVDEPDGFASCRLTAEPDGRKLRLHGTIRIEGRTITVDHWPVFQATVRQVEELGTIRFVATRKGV